MSKAVGNGLLEVLVKNASCIVFLSFPAAEFVSSAAAFYCDIGVRRIYQRQWGMDL